LRLARYVCEQSHRRLGLLATLTSSQNGNGSTMAAILMLYGERVDQVAATASLLR
jgi:hypothetical protein